MITKQKQTLTNNEKEKKKEKNILIIKILGVLAVTISVLSMLFSCVAMSKNDKSKQIQEATNTLNIQPKNKNNILSYNNDLLSDTNNSFIVNNNARVKFKMDCFIDNPRIYAESLYNVLERYYEINTNIAISGLLNKYNYYNNENDYNVERSWMVMTIKYNSEGNNKYIYLYMFENPGSASYTLTLDLQNPNESILQGDPIFYTSAHFDLMTLDVAVGSPNQSNLNPFRLWSLYFTTFQSYYRYSPSFNFTQFLQNYDVKKNNVIVRSPTPYIESDNTLSPYGYLDYTPGLFMSGGFIYDTIRVYYESGNNINFINNQNEIITGTANSYYLSKIEYLLSSNYFTTFEAFSRKYEMRTIEGTSQKVYLNSLNRSPNADELAFFDITGRFGEDKKEVSLYILSLLNAVNNDTGFSGGADAFTSIFTLIAGAFSGIVSFLNIQIFGTYTLGIFLLVPLMITIILFIVKMFKR